MKGRLKWLVIGAVAIVAVLWGMNLYKGRVSVT